MAVIDLVVLVADKNTQFALRGAFLRPPALGTRGFGFEFRTHPGRDGGARTTGTDVLARERIRFSHALLVFDLEGCGAEGNGREQIEKELDARLDLHWGADAKCIVIEPELDVWVWGADNKLHDSLGWSMTDVSARDWLRGKGFEFDLHGKPRRPKEALEALVRVLRLPRSSALYEKVTDRISLRRCQDAAFGRLRDKLRVWFPVA